MGTEMPELGERPPARVGDRTERADPRCRDLVNRMLRAGEGVCACKCVLAGPGPGAAALQAGSGLQAGRQFPSWGGRRCRHGDAHGRSRSLRQGSPAIRWHRDVAHSLLRRKFASTQLQRCFVGSELCVTPTVTIVGNPFHLLLLLFFSIEKKDSVCRQSRPLGIVRYFFN